MGRMLRKGRVYISHTILLKWVYLHVTKIGFVLSPTSVGVLSQSSAPAPFSSKILVHYMYVGPISTFQPVLSTQGQYVTFLLHANLTNIRILKLLMLARVKWAVGIFNSNFAISNH